MITFLFTSFAVLSLSIIQGCWAVWSQGEEADRRSTGGREEVCGDAEETVRKTAHIHVHPGENMYLYLTRGSSSCRMEKIRSKQKSRPATTNQTAADLEQVTLGNTSRQVSFFPLLIIHNRLFQFWLESEFYESPRCVTIFMSNKEKIILFNYLPNISSKWTD